MAQKKENYMKVVFVLDVGECPCIHYPARVTR